MTPIQLRLPTPLRAVLFDFDGLILDTETPDYHSWSEMFALHGAELRMAEWLETIGLGPDGVTWDPYDALERQIGRPIDREEVRALRRARFRALVAAETAMPGVVELLQEARRLDLRTGVASSSPSDWVEGYLAALGLRESFDAVVCADHVRRTKPDPELYLTLLAALDVRASEAIALEDSANGALAAKRAGLFTVAVPNKVTSALCFDHADLCIRSLTELRLPLQPLPHT